MNKLFYRRDFKTKTFFDKDVKIRSYAFGEKVTDSFCKWHEDITKDFDSFGENVTISESVDLSNNLVKEYKRGTKYFNIADPFHFETRETTSILAPLWWKKIFFEVQKDGYLYINGVKNQLFLGNEVYAWSLMNTLDEVFLTVVAKTQLGIGISLYKMDYDQEFNFVTYKELSQSFSNKSYILCADRNVFCIHDTYVGGAIVPVLNVFYFDGKTLDEVAIGADEHNNQCEWLTFVKPPVVLGDGGKVFWVSNNKIYYFVIGAPAEVHKLDDAFMNTIVSIQWAANSLFAMYRTKNYQTLLYKFDLCGDKKLISTDISRAYILEQDGEDLYYLCKKDINGKTKLLLIKNDGVENVISSSILNERGKGMYVSGYYVPDCIAIGYENSNKPIIIKKGNGGKRND